MKAKLLSINGMTTPETALRAGDTFEFTELEVVPPEPPKETGWTEWPSSGRAQVLLGTGDNLADVLKAAEPGTDILLFDGGVYNQPLGTLNCDDVRIGKFGEGPRPVIRPGDKDGIRIMGKGITLSDIVIEGPDDVLSTRGTGVTSTGPLSGFRMENVAIKQMGFGVSIQEFGGKLIDDVTLFRCVIADCINAVMVDGEIRQRYSSGVFINDASLLTLEECVIVGNGFRDGLLDPDEREPGTHGLYCQYEVDTARVLRNIVIGNAQNGLMVRNDYHDVSGNFIAHQPNGIVSGTAKTETLASGYVLQNTIVEGVLGIKPGSSGGMCWGMNVHDVEDMDVQENLIANPLTDAANLRGIQLGQTLRESNISENTVWNWGHAIDSSASDYEGSAIENNVLIVRSGRTALRGNAIGYSGINNISTDRADIPLKLSTLHPNLEAELRAMERGNWTHTAASLAKPWREAAGM